MAYINACPNHDKVVVLFTLSHFASGRLGLLCMTENYDPIYP